MQIVVWILMILVLAACEGRQEEKSPPAPAVTAPAAEAGRAETDLAAKADLQLGAKVYRQACATCHAEGIAGAPEMGDKEAWQPSIAKGMKVLVKNSIEGFQGNRGVMPPRGGTKSLTDEEVIAAVAYMVQQNR